MKMWHVPQLALPSHLCGIGTSADSSAESRLAPSMTSTCLPDGMMVSSDILRPPRLLLLNFSTRFALVDRRARADVDGGVLHRRDDELDLVLRQMRVKRQSKHAIRDLLGHQEVALAVAEFEIVTLQMQRMGVGSGLDLLHPEIVDDRVPAGARETRSKVNKIEKPVQLRHV